MYIVIGADVVPTKSNVELFKNGEVETLVDSGLIDYLNRAAFRIFNLEVPLTDVSAPIIKKGPHLIAPTVAITGFKALCINLLTLANNHILDQGEQGLQSTFNVLDKAGIAHVGAGDNLNKARVPYIFEFNGKKIGVYACAEHEFSIAAENKGGANPFDPLWSLDHLEVLKKMVDYVIVLYHGGKEHYRYPSPNLQKVCRRLVDKGADLVICQHSHCIGCEEKYKDGTIVYGQGNFLFDASDSEYWQTSLLISINGSFEISYVPLRKNGKGVGLAADKDKILSEFKYRSEEIKNPSFVKKKYERFADDSLNNYLQEFSGKENVFFRGINKLFRGELRKKRLKRLYDQKHITAMVNYLECEAHGELLLTGLKQRQGL